MDLSERLEILKGRAKTSFEQLESKIDVDTLKEKAAALKEKGLEQAAALKEKSLEKAAALKEKSLEQAAVIKEKSFERTKNSFSSLSNLLASQQDTPQPSQQHNGGGSSDDGSHAEDERLVNSAPGPDDADPQECTNSSKLGAAFGSKFIASAKHATATAAAAGTAGVGKLRAAQGRCGEALSAAAAVTGVSVPGALQPKEPEWKLCPCCPALSYTQRLYGCAGCVVLGTFLSLTSLGSLAQLILGNPIPFATKYTLGNLLSLGAAAFLVGPSRQCRGMFAPQRRTASLLYLGSMTGTLLTVFYLKGALLALVFIVLQFLALTWYMLSYIPYGQAAARRLSRRILRRAGFSELLADDSAAVAREGGGGIRPASSANLEPASAA